MIDARIAEHYKKYDDFKFAHQSAVTDILRTNNGNLKHVQARLSERGFPLQCPPPVRMNRTTIVVELLESVLKPTSEAVIHTSEDVIQQTAERHMNYKNGQTLHARTAQVREHPAQHPMTPLGKPNAGAYLPCAFRDMRTYEICGLPHPNELPTPTLSKPTPSPAHRKPTAVIRRSNARLMLLSKTHPDRARRNNPTKRKRK